MIDRWISPVGRVHSVVPEGFAVVAENGSVRVSGGDDYGAMMGVAMLVGSRDRVDGMAAAASAVLNSVQAYTGEERHESWPSGSERFAMPRVTVEGTTLSMWFGDQSCPALAGERHQSRPVALEICGFEEDATTSFRVGGRFCFQPPLKLPVVGEPDERFQRDDLDQRGMNQVLGHLAGREVVP